MPGPVTDPALLAQLEAAPAGARVTDPSVLAALDRAIANKKPVSKADSAARGAFQGLSLGFGDEASAALAAALPFLDREAAQGATFGERYRHARDMYRGLNAEAQEANPGTYLTGSIAGSIPTTMLLPGARAAQGASLSARIGTGAANGLGIGALAGLGSSNASGAEGMTTDAVLGGALGGLLGAGAPVAGAMLRPVAKSAANYFGSKATDFGRKAITGVSSPLSRRKALPEEVVDNAFRAGAIKPLSTVEGIAKRLEAVADPLDQQYRSILSELEARGVHGPERDALAARLMGEAQKASASSIIGTRAGALQGAAEALSQKPLPLGPNGGRLGLMQSEMMKRELQQAAQNEFVKEGPTSLSGDARKELAGIWRDEIEKAVRDQASLAPDASAQFEPTKHALHLTLQALGPAREAAARSARRSPFGLHEGMAVASGIASGNPAEALAGAGLMHALKERFASTAAATHHGLAGMAGRAAGFNAPRAGQAAAAGLAPETQALIDALRMRLGRPGIAPAAADQEGAK